ncbi:MAG: 3-phosphoshikimate 1-carboxyvinyltransferase [Deltaproteobacteria bacterium]|nr:3-phosphoshikimate 1-carboxyvinyltransferase [Deltaproteobacteria bacterium]
MMEIKPAGRSGRAVKVPGSKSLTQRALVIATLAEGRSTLRNGLVSEDTRHLVEGLRALGAGISISGDEMVITGTGGHIQNPGRTILLGNNGTALRFLTTLVSLGKGSFTLDGDRRLRERPVGALLEALNKLGVTAVSRDGKGYPPVTIETGGVSGGKVTLTDVESSQFVSSLLIGAPYAGGDVEIQLKGRMVSEPYIDMTLKVMEHFGVKAVREEENYFKVKCGRQYTGNEYLIEGDASSASYFFLAAALCQRRIRVDNMNPDSLQGDIGFLDIMEASGCSVIRGDSWIEVVGRPLRGGELSLNMGKMPDMVPTLAVLAAFRPGRTVITHVSHLRFKESDRILSLVNELNRIGVRAEETEDGLIIEGGKARGAEIETYNDHRIAMSFAVAGLAIPGMRICDKHCVDKSFPGFWDEMEKL